VADILLIDYIMINPIPIEVECYSGYKADEYPKCFYMAGNKYEIKEILDRWYQGNRDPKWIAANYFKVVTTDGKKFILKHEIEIDEWSLIKW
jgi:hypothetical protein